ncbi:AbgT family transporter [Fusobacterium hominis]|uniref:AbgT family transporter n=1 Tax=Fusobacterium hominis TaxID=2764326 RepID=A0A7G9GWG2_9FUSO|nr:AbgT family transporter [Fusobacterium hominis]QNM15144.1 AbgT family transporter [Fusobacterium hominis]
MSAKIKKEGWILKALDKVEKIGNGLPHPTTMFIIFTILLILLSWLAEKNGLKVSYEVYDPITKHLTLKETAAVSLLSKNSIRFMYTSIITNFTNFIALGTVFTIIMGVGVADGSGFMSAVLKKIVAITPKRAVTATVIFLGIMSNVASSTGYVMLVPLGAILFMSFGRHPIAGMAATFAGVSGGWSANLLIGTNDPVFAGMSTEAARMIDPSYTVLPTGNWYFMIASTFLITFIGTIVTEKIIEPRLGTYIPDEKIQVNDISKDEKRGMKFALISLVVFFIVVGCLILPTNGILRNPQTGELLRSPFMSGIVFLMSLFFMIPGIFYGIGAGSIKSDKDIIDLMTKSITNLSGFMVLVFFAAQFVVFFNYSNLGIILSVKGAEFLKNTGFVGIPLIIVFIIMTAIINIFIAVDSAKWAIMAPIFVPMFMRIGFSPELTQAAYRVGDSCTNVIAPLMPFFPLIVAFAQKYDKKSGVGTLISLMIPYSIAFLIGWIILLIIWYLFAIPLGIGGTLIYTI